MISLLRIVAVILLYFCNLAHVHAEEQGSRRSLLRIGGFVGGGFVVWAGQDADLPGQVAVAKPGFSAGLLATLDVSRLLPHSGTTFRLGVQPELAYATKGTRFERDGVYRGVHVDLSYLQTDVLLRAEYTTAERVTPYVLLGPMIGFLRSAEYEGGLGNTIDVKDDLKSMDVGLIGGLGALFSFPPWGAASLELRADLGLVSIERADIERRNAALTLLLGYLY